MSFILQCNHPNTYQVKFLSGEGREMTSEYHRNHNDLESGDLLHWNVILMQRYVVHAVSV